MDKDPDAAKKLWENFGGDFNKFTEAVSKGAARKPLFGEKRKKGVSGYNYAPDYVGEPVTAATIATAIGAAAPIIAALLAAFKKAGIKDTPEETPPADDD